MGVQSPGLAQLHETKATHRQGVPFKIPEQFQGKGGSTASLFLEVRKRTAGELLVRSLAELAGPAVLRGRASEMTHPPSQSHSKGIVGWGMW